MLTQPKLAFHTCALFTTAFLLMCGAHASAQDAPQPAQDQDRWYNHDSLTFGATVHSFAGDVGDISPFFGFGAKWQTWSDFQGVDQLEGATIWEFIGLGLEVFYFQNLTAYPATLETGDQTLEFDADMFQLGILATLLYTPGDFHPYLGIGVAWNELSAQDDSLLPGSEIFPMLDSQFGARYDLHPSLSIDFAMYGNWGRNGNLGLKETRNVFFFTTFLGLSWNII